MRRLFSAVVAVVLLLGAANQVPANVIIFNTMPDNPASTPETLLGRSIMNVLSVGASDVQITGFGTFGEIHALGNLQWVIFPNSVGSSPLFSTGPIAATDPGHNVWNDSPTFNFTLLANTTYQLGVMADQSFTYNWDFPGTTVSQGGLTQPSSTNGNAENFDHPVLTGGGSVVNSLRVFGPESTPIPEPSTMVMASMLLGIFGMVGIRNKLRSL